MYTSEPNTGPRSRPPNLEEEFEEGILENLKLGHDVRFILAVVGGGAIRVGREIARRHLRYVETVAINCDPRVQGLDEFDRRVCLGPESGAEGDTGGSSVVGGLLARAAEPALERIFDGATFVTVVGSLGGGSGTGALPYVLEAAARQSEVLSVFVIKPFQCEGDRRSVADRALARLNFVEAFVEKEQRGLATLQVLDNEYLARRDRHLPLHQLASHWAEVISSHIEKAFVLPAEASVQAFHLGRGSGAETLPTALTIDAGVIEAQELEPPAPPFAPPQPPPDVPMAAPSYVELTFEIEAPAPGPEVR